RHFMPASLSLPRAGCLFLYLRFAPRPPGFHAVCDRSSNSVSSFRSELEGCAWRTDGLRAGGESSGARHGDAPMNMQVLDARRDANGGYRVDVSRGERVGRVSSEWFSRPADERYLSLNELARTVRDRTDRSRTRVVESALIHVEANRADPERLALMLPGSDTPVAPTHWSFGQLASQVGAPAAYLRQLPAALAGINLQYGLTANRAEQIKTLETDDGRVEL